MSPRKHKELMKNPAYRWWKSSDLDDVLRVVQRAGTTFDYFKQIAYGNRVPSRELAWKLERYSKGAITAGELLFGPHLKR